ncbi:MAG TPA: hypothetical protein PLM07_08360 [Candidatus Rifleibacterium sp.]|nr:hypothetical protein [Candidatus Rifleibacterium sp.]HPT45898.1 hypothetical protein [Candidatus Rifleibacterium sp.]
MAIFLALMAANAEFTYRKEIKDARRYHLEIRSRKLARHSCSNCTSGDGLACQPLYDKPVPDEPARAKADEATREQA